VYELSFQHQIGSVLHLYALCKQPQLAVTDKIIVEMGSGDAHNCFVFGTNIQKAKGGYNKKQSVY